MVLIAAFNQPGLQSQGVKAQKGPTDPQKVHQSEQATQAKGTAPSVEIYDDPVLVVKTRNENPTINQ